MRTNLDINIASFEEWLAVWEAVSEYVDNAQDVADEDPQVFAALGAARAVLDRMDEEFIRRAEYLPEERVPSCR